MEGKKQFWKGLVLGFVVTLVLVEAAIFGAGALEKFQKKAADTPQADLTNSEIERKLDEIEALVNEQYLEEVDPQTVEDFLYKGVVAGLGDVYGAYYTREEYESMKESTSGSYCGIGVEMSQDMTTGIIKVNRVFEGSPAMEAGLRPGDIFYMVEDLEVTGEDLTKVVSLIKGAEYTKVHLRMARDGEMEYLDFDVERRMVEVPSVEYEMLENRIGYIAISSFDEVTAGQFTNALKKLETQGMQSLIVDLRNNGGGLVSSVCSILDELLPEGLIVYTEDKYGYREEEFSDGKHFFDKPLAVLINENSASASEIFAGAIKDYGIGTLVGTKTFGKGIVQKIFPLYDGTAVKLTVSKYYTPKGNYIHGVGIEPDVEVDLEESLKYQVLIPREQDIQLQKAMEVVYGS